MKSETLRSDGASELGHSGEQGRTCARLIMVGLALFFVILGAIDLDLGPAEARLGLAAGEKPGPLGQVFGYWAPDLWPAQVIPSFVLGRLEAFGRPSSAAVRWPAAHGGYPRRMDDRAEHGQGPWAACRRAIWDLLVRQPGTDRSIVGDRPRPDRGTGHPGVDRPAHHAGFGPGRRTVGGPGVSGWRLACIVGDRPGNHRHRQATAGFVRRWLLPPLVRRFLVVLDNLGFLRRGLGRVAHASFDQKPAWTLGATGDGLGLPWSPFAFLVLSRSIRQGWNHDGTAVAIGWLQVAWRVAHRGTLVPGLGQAARMVALAGLLVGPRRVSGIGLDSNPSRNPAAPFFVAFAGACSGSG